MDRLPVVSIASSFILRESIHMMKRVLLLSMVMVMLLARTV